MGYEVGTLNRKIINNGAVKVFAVLVAYWLGYLQISVTWVVVPVILDIIRDFYTKKKIEKRDFIRRIAAKGEKEVVGSLKDLPAWICFPDVERVEWLNIIIKQLWPNVNNYVKDVINELVEHKIKKRLEKYKLSGFVFERIVLGSVPFRFGGVIVYQNVNRNEIIMDIDISYAGDCDVTFRLSKMKGGIKNFQLYGTLRIVLKPLIKTLPFTGGLQIFFLNPPDIDFNLDGIVGVLEVTGINELLKKIIKDTVSSLMVLPNKLPIRISPYVTSEEVKAPNPNGVLRIHLIQGKALAKRERWMDLLKSDTYAVIGVGDQTHRTTATDDDSENPIWDFWCEFVIEEMEGQELYIQLWDQDDNEVFGKCSVQISSLIKLGQSDMWLKCENGKQGEIHVRATWIMLSTKYSDLQNALYEVEQLKLSWIHSSLLIVFLDCASNLPQVKSSVKPDPYVFLQVEGNEKTTKVALRKVNPVWEEGFVFVLQNPDSACLTLKVIDSKTENILAELTYNISNLYNRPGLEIVEYPFRLKSRLESRITCSFYLKIFKNKNCKRKGSRNGDSDTSSDESNSDKQSDIENVKRARLKSQENSDINPEQVIRHRNLADSTSRPERTKTKSNSEESVGQINLTLRYSVQRQRLIVVVHSLENIQSKDDEPKDVYVKLYLLPERDKETKRKTQLKNNANATFDETFEFLISLDELNAKQLEVSVIEDKVIRNEVLGEVLVNLDKYSLVIPHTEQFNLISKCRKTS